MVSELLAQSIGIKINPSNFVRTFTASDIVKVYKVTLPEISALGKKTKSVPAIVKSLTRSSPVDGLLGLSFFRRFDDLNISFDEEILVLN